MAIGNDFVMTRSAVPTLAARFESMEIARAAIERLENSGVDGSDIQLLGSGAETRSPPNPQSEDADIGSYVLPRVASGTIIGAVAGAAAGLVVGIGLRTATELSITAGMIVAFVLAGLLVGSVTGAFVGLERRVGFSETWTRTFDERTSGPLWVAVRARDQTVFERARNALQTVGPLELRSNRAARERS